MLSFLLLIKTVKLKHFYLPLSIFNSNMSNIVFWDFILPLIGKYNGIVNIY